MLASSPWNQVVSSCFGRPSQQAIQFLHQQQNELQNSMLYQQMSGFFEQSVERMTDLTVGVTARKIEALYNKSQALFQENEIRTITDIGEMQNAPDVMIPYIMAVPTIQEMYQNEELVGYGDRYVSPYEGIAHDNFIYRTANHGMVHAATDEEEATSFRQYWESHATGAALTHHQKVAINQTMRSAAWIIENDVHDCTSEWNELL